MDLASFLGTIGRHVKLGIVCLIVTALGTVAVVQRVQPTYETTGSLLLVPPNVSPSSNSNNPNVKTNPVLALGPYLATFASAVATVASSPQVIDRMTSLGLSTSYKVIEPADSPIIQITVQAGSSATAQASFDALKQEILRVNTEQQITSGSPTSQLIRLQTLTPPTTVITTSARFRVAIGVFGIGLVLSVICIYAIDFATRRRRERRAGRDESSMGRRRSRRARNRRGDEARDEARDDAGRGTEKDVAAGTGAGSAANGAGEPVNGDTAVPAHPFRAATEVTSVSPRSGQELSHTHET